VADPPADTEKKAGPALGPRRSVNALLELGERVPPLVRDIDWTIGQLEELMTSIEEMARTAYGLGEMAMCDAGLSGIASITKKEIAAGAEFARPWAELRKARRKLPRHPRLAYMHMQEARQMMRREIAIASRLWDIDQERHQAPKYCPTPQECDLMVGIRERMLAGEYDEADRMLQALHAEVLRSSRAGVADDMAVTLEGAQGVVGEPCEVKVLVRNASSRVMKLQAMEFSATGGYVEKYTARPSVLEHGGVYEHEFYFTPVKAGDNDIVAKAEFVIDGMSVTVERHLNFHAEPAPVVVAVAAPAEAARASYRSRVRNVDGEPVLAAGDLLEGGAPPREWASALEMAMREGASIDLGTRRSITVRREDGTEEAQEKDLGELDSLPGYPSMWQAAFCVDPGAEAAQWREWIRRGPFRGDELAKRAYAHVFELATGKDGMVQFSNDRGVLASTAGYVRDAMFCLVGMTINSPAYAAYRERPMEFYQLKEERMAWEADVATASGVRRVRVREEIVISADGKAVERYVFRLDAS
jgi:hypothetical protein